MTGPHAARALRRGGSLGILLVLVLGSAAQGVESAFLSRLLSPEPGWHASRGAFSATGSGLEALPGNPAGLAGTVRARLALSHLGWGESLAREWLAIGVATGRSGAVAADVGILRASGLVAYDARGNEIGAIRASEWNAGLTGARALGAGLAAGLGARYLRLEEPTAPLGGAAASAGLLYRRGGLALGLAVIDLGPRFSSARGQWSPPTRGIAGLELQDRQGRWILGAAGATRPGREWVLSVGAALRPGAGVELLGGCALDANGHGFPGPGWGTGLRLTQGGYAVAYAVQSAGEIGLTHQFGLSFAPSRGR